MSSRQLRKLQKQKELEELQAKNSLEDDDEPSDDDRPVQKPRAGAFSGFAALGDQDDQDEDSDHDAKEDELVEATTKPSVEPDRTDAPKSSSKKNKKKKKKAKKQDGTPAKTEPIAQSGPDEIDQALKELELSNPGQEIEDDFQLKIVKPYERICELLSINAYHLRVINEMSNLFGREAIAAAQIEEQEQARTRRQRQPLPQQVDLETYLKGVPGKGLPEVTLRRNPFLAGKETWPRASTEGLTMEQFKEEKEGVACLPGTIEFRFAHDSYTTGWKMRSLNSYRYLCERALFTFGRVSLSTFRQKIEQGKARLSFNRPENRQFWLAGYHYLKNLIMKGTYRTALEWAKLLLSIDHTDPYGVIHFIHPLAIRARESKWFIDLCDSEILDVNHAAQDGQDYIRQTLVLARLQQKDTAGAKALLVEGMERLPWLYSYLFKALNLDVPKAIWGTQPRNRDEELHTNVYIHQTKPLWDNTQAISLLKEVAGEAKRADVNKPSPFPSPPTVGVNIARFVFLLEIPSLIGLVPRDLLNTSVNWEFDPLPPPLEQNVFSYDSQKQPWTPSQLEDRLRAGLEQGDRRQLMRILAQARLAGAPEDIQADLERAILEEADGGGGNHDDGGGDDDGEVSENASEEGGSQNEASLGRWSTIFQAVMNLFDTNEGVADNFNMPNEPFGHIPGTMPGTWQDEDSVEEETDDEMPPLIPPGNSTNPRGPGNGADDTGNGTDDEMPRLA
ncbi:hypothetical protein GL218_00853 [Daldinia childiae]|uniref:uncharacterized protein n=1 Tax=Daldinia childiae TaxID=326645 RepID=UPI001447B0BA|nr:uncharacterized protein GL218_00853 [Daldinia childiae]KAF3071295.1 hypothetical protein GL218_00853 [Daldinia childiae]